MMVLIHLSFWRVDEISKYNENSGTDIITQEYEKARFTLLLTAFLAVVVFLGVLYFGLIFPMTVSTVLAERIATTPLGLPYKILVMVCLLLWLIAMIIAFAVPFFKLRSDSNFKEHLVTINNERLKPTKPRTKAKKTFVDSLALLGLLVFITSQVILYAFIV